MIRNDWSEAKTYEMSASHIFIGFIMYALTTTQIKEFQTMFIPSALIMAAGVFLFITAKMQFKKKRWP